nr:DUF4912 domain-containing protein [Cohnella sp. CFH 77786]
MLHLMVQNARSLYLYWEVGSRRRNLTERHFGCPWGTMPKIIRLYDTTCVYFDGHNANGYFDIETTPEAVNWYIHGVQPGITYTADFGTYSIHRQFVPLLRSNVVVTPRDSVPDAAEPAGGPVNFTAYAQAMRKGVYLFDESAAEEETGGRKLRLPDAGPPPASALYPPS